MDETGCIEGAYLSPSGVYGVICQTSVTAPNELWILEMATLQIQDQFMVPGDCPEVVPVRESTYEIAWSPDEEGLFFVAATEKGGGELGAFLYNLSVKKLSVPLVEANLVHTLGWSPDSEWVVFIEGEKGFQRAWAVRASTGKATVVYHTGRESSYWGIHLGWVTNSRFVVLETLSEGCDWMLREGNVASMSAKVLFGPALSGAALDPSSGTIFFGIIEYGMCEYSLDPGIYRIKANNVTPQLVLEGLDWDFFPHWSSELGEFVIQNDDRTSASLYSPSGQEDRRLENAKTIFPSPDGLWILVERADSGVLELRDHRGEVVGAVWEAAVDQVVWFPDSEGFYVRIGDELHRAT